LFLGIIPNGLSIGWTKNDRERVTETAAIDQMQHRSTDSFLETDLNPAARRIYSHLLMNVDNKGQIPCSHRHLCKACRVSFKTVITSIRQLKALGLLRIVRETGYANLDLLYPPIGSFESIRQISLITKWLELEGGLTAILVRPKVSSH
jgi:hypothetical protein